MTRKFLPILFFIACTLAAVIVTARHYRNSLENVWKAFSSRVTENVSNTAQPRNSRDIYANIMMRLARLEVDSSRIKSLFFLEQNTREIQAEIPRGKPLEWVVWELSAAAGGTGYRVVDCFWEKKRKVCHITFEIPGKKQEKIRLMIREGTRYFSTTAKMAILIEEFEFNPDKTTVEFLSFPQPLTVTLAPSRESSEWTSKIADHYRKEILIFLPMESKITPHSKPKSPVILVHYSANQIRDIMTQAMKYIPNHSGFCNSLGSRALEDSRVTGIVLSEIKSNHGYFVDTKTTPNSIVPSIARDLKVPFREIDDTIERTAGETTIDTLLMMFTLRAHRTGSILVRGYPTAPLIHALNRHLPSFREYGIKLVYVSEIVRHPE